MSMDETHVKKYLLANFAGVDMIEDEGNLFFFCDPKNRVPFATVVTTSKYDTYSDLDRPGVYRLNIGVGKDTYRSLFPSGQMPLELGYDFTANDVILPHPEYGRIYWICVLNPSEATFDALKPMLAEAHELAIKKYDSAQAASKRQAQTR